MKAIALAPGQGSPDKHVARQRSSVVDLKPCILERKILPKVWGGQALASVLGLSLPPGEAIGETWELFDRPDGASPIRGSDKTVRDLMLEDPEGLLGRGVRPTPQGYFPLLLKYIDAADKLSVQVHPDDEAAAAEGDSGKSEAWIVLSAGDGARIICGLKPGVTREQFAAVAHEKAVEDLLQEFHPTSGEAFYVPAGVVHSIGPDVVLFEVQQNSDVTYRLYDWGRPRETHVDKALGAIRFSAGDGGPTAATPIGDDAEWLFRNEFFTTRRMRVKGPSTFGSAGCFKILSVVEGRGTIGWHSRGQEPPLMLNPGDTVLIPAVTDVTFLSSIGTMTLLVCGPGGKD